MHGVGPSIGEPKIKHEFRKQNKITDLLARDVQMLIDDKLFEE